MSFISKIAKGFANSRSDAKEVTFFYHIDTFDCADGRLSVSGWVFFADADTSGVAVCFRRKDADGAEKQYAVDAVYGNPRPDIFGIFGTERAYSAGFFAEIGYENADGFEATLLVTAAGRREELPLGKLPKTGAVGGQAGQGAQDTSPAFSVFKDSNRPVFEYPSLVVRGRSANDGDVPPKSWKPALCLTSDEAIQACAVDIIIPVYNGFEYLERLFETVQKTKMQHRLIVIDDASPDNRVWPFLQQRAADAIAAGADFLLLRNDTNLGFVKTANRGFAVAEHHVCLLNTDVELPDDWLERLMAPIFTDETIASATPFTNSGTILSFPIFARDNELPIGLSAIEVDNMFRKILPSYTEIPSGVGFCMGVHQNALYAVGFFDTDNFEKGYGEENDWCFRAAALGYRNVAVENLFVWHKHGGSFSSDEKTRLMAQNATRLSEKHPDYDAAVASFIRLDPLAKYRNFALFEALKEKPVSHTTLVFAHDWGGGAEHYLEERIHVMLAEGSRLVIIRTDSERHVFEIFLRFGPFESAFVFKELCELLAILGDVSIDDIFVNELASYPNTRDALDMICTLRKKTGAALTFALHDYFCICPTIHIVTQDAIFCGLPAPEACASCLAENPYKVHGIGDIIAWREMWRTFMESCDEILCFSESSKALIGEIFQGLHGLRVRPHEVDYISYITNINRAEKTTDTINIGLIGKLNDIKGRKIVEQMLTHMASCGETAQALSSPFSEVRFILIGYSEPPLSAEFFTETGSYTRDELPSLLLEHDIDVVFIASAWPETFSYTTKEAMAMGLPVCTFDLGAQAEHVRTLGTNGLLLPYGDKALSLSSDAFSALCEFAQSKALEREVNIE